jgi:hypothetical protein
MLVGNRHRDLAIDAIRQEKLYLHLDAVARISVKFELACVLSATNVQSCPHRR